MFLFRYEGGSNERFPLAKFKPRLLYKCDVSLNTSNDRFLQATVRILAYRAHRLPVKGLQVSAYCKIASAQSPAILIECVVLLRSVMQCCH
jgi:hypothetical protein